MNWVKNRDRLLLAEISLSVDVSTKADKTGTRRAKNMSIAICLFLSWKLFMYALDTLFVASDRTPSCHYQQTVEVRGNQSQFLPANVRFPLLVKLVFSAPVPA